MASNYELRKFATGATRDADKDKFDYEGFLSPTVLESYAAYMHKNRIQPDGNLRDSDNWKLGIPRAAYVKSAFRHFIQLWKEWRGQRREDELLEAANALLFNIMGFIHETLRMSDDSSYGHGV